MTINEFKLSYKEFLTKVTKHSYNSANKYVSYINKACLLPGMNELWHKLSTTNDTIIRTHYVEQLCDAITGAFSDPSCTISEKDLRDCQSSAHVLLAFVSGQTWVKHNGIKVQFTAVYSYRALRNKFLSRLTTQDRIYSFGAFPIHIINCMANSKKVSLFDRMIDEIKIVYNKSGAFFYFKDVTRIMLASDGYAYLEKAGTIYPVFTQIPQKAPAEYCLLKAIKIDELSLDHDNPVENELKKYISNMPILGVLSKDISNFKRTYKATHKKADNRTVLNAYKNHMISIDEEELLEEIKMFLEKLSLTIMQRNFNSSKNNTTTMSSLIP